MRFKNLLGLLALGGAVAYAQKKRGGDLSFQGIKNSLKGALDNLRSKVEDLKATSARSANLTSSPSDVGTSDLGTSSRSGIADDYASTSGYSSRSG